MKKNLLIIVILIIIVALGVAGYFFLIKKEPIVWDGTYKMTGTLACEGNFPNLTTLPMDTDITVADNKVVDRLGDTVKTFEIDKRGKATEVVEPHTSQGVTVSGEVEYKFSKKDDVYKFTAEASLVMSAAQGGITYSSTCSGTIAGIKQ